MKNKCIPQNVGQRPKGPNILKNRPGPKAETLSLHPLEPSKAIEILLRPQAKSEKARQSIIPRPNQKTG